MSFVRPTMNGMQPEAKQPSFMPQNVAVRSACFELDDRRQAGEKVPVVARVWCHNKVIATAWELEPGRALLRSTSRRDLTSIVGGGEPERPGPRRRVIEAILVDDPADVFEQARRAPTRCPRGHGVMLTRAEARSAIQMARQRARAVSLLMEIHGNNSTAVLSSVQ